MTVEKPSHDSKDIKMFYRCNSAYKLVGVNNINIETETLSNIELLRFNFYASYK